MIFIFRVIAFIFLNYIGLFFSILNFENMPKHFSSIV